MSLAEVIALDADSSSSLSLFVHCNDSVNDSVTPSSSSSSPTSPLLHVQLMDPPTLYEADVASYQKPRALDCSGAEYVAAIKSALTASLSDQEPRFELRWSKSHQTLTFMEKTGFAMKFCAIQFTEVKSVAKWQTFLQELATHQKQMAKCIAEKEDKVQQCETLLKQKETLLETALSAKQKIENELFQGFCAVLNTKKDEIQRLQLEVEAMKEMHQLEVKPTKKRKVTVPRGKQRPRGAKLEKKTVKNEENDENMSDESDESNTSRNESNSDEEMEKKRTKNDAIKAYRALPSTLRSNGMQISSADDLLLSMDSIIENEGKQDEATLRNESSSGKDLIKIEPTATKRTVESVKPRTRKAGSGPSEVKPPSNILQDDEPMDSEEDDILDMLS